MLTSNMQTPSTEDGREALYKELCQEKKKTQKTLKEEDLVACN